MNGVVRNSKLNYNRILTSFSVSKLSIKSSIGSLTINGEFKSDIWKTTGYIDGKWTDGDNSERYSVINPSTGLAIGWCPRMDVKNANEAVNAASLAWKRWRTLSAVDRSSYLKSISESMLKHKDDLATIITLESGKPFAEALGEVLYAKSFLDFYVEEGKRIQGTVMIANIKGQKQLTIKESVGPALMITPWNFPLASKFELYNITMIML